MSWLQPFGLTWTQRKNEISLISKNGFLGCHNSLARSPRPSSIKHEAITVALDKRIPARRTDRNNK